MSTSISISFIFIPYLCLSIDLVATKFKLHNLNFIIFGKGFLKNYLPYLKRSTKNIKVVSICFRYLFKNYKYYILSTMIPVNNFSDLPMTANIL